MLTSDQIAQQTQGGFPGVSDMSQAHSNGHDFGFTKQPVSNGGFGAVSALGAAGSGASGAADAITMGVMGAQFANWGATKMGSTALTGLAGSMGGAAYGGLGSMVAANPLALGLMTAGKAAQWTSQGLQRGMNSYNSAGNYMADKGFASGRGQGGFGYSFNDQSQLGGAISRMGQENAFVGYEDQEKLMQSFSGMGMEKGITNVGTLIEKFKEFSEVTEDVARAMGKTVHDVTGLVRDLKGQGFLSADEVKGTVTRMQVGSQYGLSSQDQMNTMNSFAAQGRGRGLLGRESATFGLNMSNMIGAGIKSGALDEQNLFSMTGTSNLADANKSLTNSIGNSFMGAMSKGGKLEPLIAGAMRVDKDGKVSLDKDILSRVESGDIDMDQLSVMAQKNNNLHKGVFKANRGRLSSELLGSDNAFGIVGGAMSSLTDKAMLTGDMDRDTAEELISQSVLGMDEQSSKALRELMDEKVAISGQKRKDMAQQIVSEAEREYEATHGLSGLSKNFSQKMNVLTHNQGLQDTGRSTKSWYERSKYQFKRGFDRVGDNAISTSSLGSVDGAIMDSISGGATTDLYAKRNALIDAANSGTQWAVRDQLGSAISDERKDELSANVYAPQENDSLGSFRGRMNRIDNMSRSESEWLLASKGTAQQRRDLRGEYRVMNKGVAGQGIGMIERWTSGEARALSEENGISIEEASSILSKDSTEDLGDAYAGKRGVQANMESRESDWGSIMTQLKSDDVETFVAGAYKAGGNIAMKMPRFIAAMWSAGEKDELSDMLRKGKGMSLIKRLTSEGNAREIDEEIEASLGEKDNQAEAYTLAAENLTAKYGEPVDAADVEAYARKMQLDVGGTSESRLKSGEYAGTIGLGKKANALAKDSTQRVAYAGIAKQLRKEKGGTALAVKLAAGGGYKAIYEKALAMQEEGDDGGDEGALGVLGMSRDDVAGLKGKTLAESEFGAERLKVITAVTGIGKDVQLEQTHIKKITAELNARDLWVKSQIKETTGAEFANGEAGSAAGNLFEGTKELNTSIRKTVQMIDELAYNVNVLTKKSNLPSPGDDES